MPDKQTDIDLGSLNTLSLPCIAREKLEFHSPEELINCQSLTGSQAADRLILGGGSNLLLPPVLDRVVIQYHGRSCCYAEASNGDVLVIAEAGLPWDELVEATVSRDLRGVENLSLIPGTVGAAPVQNIGAYGVELSALLEWVQVFNFESGQLEQFDREQCQFAYRDSWFKQHSGERLIVKVCLRLSADRPLTLDYGELRQIASDQTLTAADIRARIITLRRQKLPDPADLANVGSFFKNPVISGELARQLRVEFPAIVIYPQAGGQFKVAAGWLIDQDGWKGVRRGAVGVHAQQALVLVNYGSATRRQLLDLASDIQDSVLQKFSISLEIEPVIID